MTNFTQSVLLYSLQVAPSPLDSFFSFYFLHFYINICSVSVATPLKVCTRPLRANRPIREARSTPQRENTTNWEYTGKTATFQTLPEVRGRRSRPGHTVGHLFLVERLRVHIRLMATKEQKSLGLRLKSHFQRFYLQRIYSRNQTYDFLQRPRNTTNGNWKKWKKNEISRRTNAKPGSRTDRGCSHRETR